MQILLSANKLSYLLAGYREKSRATRKKTWGEMQGKKGELSFAPPLAALPLARAFCRTSLRSPLQTDSLSNNNLGIRIAGSSCRPQ